MPELREVDSNLMLAAGLEAAFDERRVRQPLDRCDMRHRSFRVGGKRAAGPPKMSV